MSPTSFRRAAMRAAFPTLLAGALVASVPALMEAQQTGNITGTVRNATNGQSLAGAQVSIPAINAGILANNVGRYLIPNVPVGTHTMTVTFIGYETVTAEVTVTAGGAVVQDFEMRSEAISLEGVVVTGTAGAARRREVGNSINQLNQQEFESAPVANVADILQGRALGATVLTNGGQVGAGSTIKLRGNNSVSFSNSPLVYVDGVRIRERGMVHAQEANQQRNPFDDINPADIERIETIQGAAATTLYGTEAAGGVIQIFTKRGVAGAPAWSLTIDQGLNTLGHIGPPADVNPTGLGLNNCNFTGDDNFPGGDPMFPVDDSCPEGGDWLKNGVVQNYNLSVRGGAQRMNYFMSANWGNEEGVFDTGIDDNGVARPTQGVESWRLRGNFAFAPVNAMDVRFNTSYAHREITWVPDGNNAEGLLLNVFRGGSDYTNDSDGKLLDMGVNNIADHFTSGMNITWTPLDGMSHRLNTGIDWNRDTYFENRPWGYFYVQGGNRETVERTYRYLTLDYAGSYDSEIFGLSSSFSVGGQLYNNFITGTTGRRPRTLPVPVRQGAGIRRDHVGLRGEQHGDQRWILPSGGCRAVRQALRDPRPARGRPLRIWPGLRIGAVSQGVVLVRDLGRVLLPGLLRHLEAAGSVRRIRKGPGTLRRDPDLELGGRRQRQAGRDALQPRQPEPRAGAHAGSGNWASREPPSTTASALSTSTSIRTPSTR